MPIETIYNTNFTSPTNTGRVEFTNVGTGIFQVYESGQTGFAPVDFKASTLEIWTASSGGTQLTLDTDYTLEYLNEDLTDAAEYNVNAGLKVINATYQTGSIWIDCDIVGQEIAAEVINELQDQIDDNVTDIATNTAAIASLSAGTYTGIYNCQLSNNATDSANDIDIATGTCVDSTLTYGMSLSSGLTKQLDAAWAVGTNAGGLFTGSMAASTTYHVFLIRKDSDGSIDAGFDTSVTAANIPSGYTAYRRIGSIMTDATPEIIQFFHTWEDKTFVFEIRKATATSVDIATTAGGTLYTFDVPIGISVKLIASVHANMSSGGISSSGANETATISGSLASSNFRGDFYAYNTGSYIVGNASALLPFHKTNTSGQIKLIRVGSYFSGDLASYNTIGWIDYTL